MKIDDEEFDSEDRSSKHYIFDMDGMPHFSYTTGCCDLHGKACIACGGWMHFQPVYGGYCHKCEQCKREI